MSDTLNTYFFLPWLRTGTANKIETIGGTRAQVTVSFNVTPTLLEGQAAPADTGVSQTVFLTGPGDITGIDHKAIVKHEPRNWITNFEPNYLPYIEFYDEDFPWRYTPDKPGGGAAGNDRLTPWLTLAVLKETEFDDGVGKPLPWFQLKSETAIDTAFPSASELWAWAHVHVNQTLKNDAAVFPVSDSINPDNFLDLFGPELDKDPDIAYSRLLSPRKLEENTAYHAFLIPTFESGRLTGLGKDFDVDSPAFGDANHCAWVAYNGQEEPGRFPYYFRWYFRTGTVGDFEYLVRLLKPRPVSSEVGRRNIDVTDPGWKLPAIGSPGDGALEGVLRLGGALEAPDSVLSNEEKTVKIAYENWDQNTYPQPFQKELAGFINLADQYTKDSAGIANADSVFAAENYPDPILTPPLYGGHHKKTGRLLYSREDTTKVSPSVPYPANWLHQLNLDPRHRTAAGFGAAVVQKNQEEYMKAAWEQYGDIMEANKKIKLAQLAVMTSKAWYDNHIVPIKKKSASLALWLFEPAAKRIMVNGLTVFGNIFKSALPKASLSAPFRRILRPRGPLARRLTLRLLNKFPGFSWQPFTLIDLINSGKVSAAPPKVTPPALTTLDEAAGAVRPKWVPAWLAACLKKHSWIKYLPIAVAVLLAVLRLLIQMNTALTIVLGSFVAVFLALLILLLRADILLKRSAVIKEENCTPQYVAGLPALSDFTLTTFETRKNKTVYTIAISDNSESRAFKAALTDVYTLTQLSLEVSTFSAKKPLDISSMVSGMVAKMDPLKTIPFHVLQSIDIPEFSHNPKIKAMVLEKFYQIMAYPVIDVPMYKPLYEISSENFVPNLNKIEQNSITLLETYQDFIEAYMVGVNFEFNKELLWRGYPCDLMGTSFRQFWDVSSMLAANPQENPESYKDIPEIHKWPMGSNLGDHDNRQTGEAKEEVVLVIRGELLKKYPTAVIYAQKAEWVIKDGAIDLTQARNLVTLTPEDITNQNRDKIKSPLYEAKVDPDIYFFGFDLSEEEAKGFSGENPGNDDNPGWFFVIKERPGEPRFGLDVAENGASNNLEFWSDLSWGQVSKPNGFLEIGNSSTLTVNRPLSDQDYLDQYNEDSAVEWNSSMSAAEVAYILYQLPVKVGVHASEMLVKKGN